MPEYFRLSTKQYPLMGCIFIGVPMRLIGLDIVERFRSQNCRETWVWEVDALILEISNQVWSDEKELCRDYPSADTRLPKVTFKIAGGRVLVECLVLFQAGIVLLKQLVLRTVQQAPKACRQTGDAA
ncbi:hypothetical protein HKX21_17525 [Sulfitobacter sp. KS8]|nr:hypothetical protein [Sulfitobacter sp. KS8]